MCRMDTIKTARCLLAAALATSFAACQPDEPRPDADASAMQTPAAPEATVAPVVPEDGVPEAVVVSTNEPFWQAWVEGGELVLVGAGVDERRYPILSSRLEPSQADQALRVVNAADASGKVEIRVAHLACQDSMSGAGFPMTGTLSIDGGEAITGCARPAIPAHFHGRWAPDAAGCKDAAATIEDIEIDGRGMRFHESMAFPLEVSIVDGGSVRLANRYSGEGEQWEAQQTLAVSGDTLVITGPDDQRLERIRCRD